MDGFRPSRERPGGEAEDHDDHAHGHSMSALDWTSDLPLSLPKLRSALETLPDTVFRCKRIHLTETGRWGSEPPRSEIVMIGARDGINDEELQSAFDACVGTGDETQSPILRLARKLELAI
jgi:hypothetical protein